MEDIGQKAIVRPTSLTVICWFLIVICILSLILSSFGLSSAAALAVMAQSKVPVAVQIAILYVGLVANIVFAIAMLKGKGWGRTGYFGWSVFGSVFGLLTSPAPLTTLPGILLVLVFVFLLTREKVSLYFRAAHHAKCC